MAGFFARLTDSRRPNNVPMGEISYFDVTGSGITISGTSDGSTNMVVADPETTLLNYRSFDNGGANTGRLRYTGSDDRMFHVALTMSCAPLNPNDVYVLGAAKGGTVLDSSKVLGSFLGEGFSALHVMTPMSTNDYIELYIGNTSGARGITIHSLNIFAMGML